MRAWIVAGVALAALGGVAVAQGGRPMRVPTVGAPEPVTANTVGGAGRDLAMLTARIEALEAENKSLKSEVALIKTQVGNAVVVNVQQGQAINDMKPKLDKLAQRFKTHTHWTRLWQATSAPGHLGWMSTSTFDQSCSAQGCAPNPALQGD